MVLKDDVEDIYSISSTPQYGLSFEKEHDYNSKNSNSSALPLSSMAAVNCCLECSHLWRDAEESEADTDFSLLLENKGFKEQPSARVRHLSRGKQLKERFPVTHPLTRTPCTAQALNLNEAILKEQQHQRQHSSLHSSSTTSDNRGVSNYLLNPSLLSDLPLTYDGLPSLRRLSHSNTQETQEKPGFSDIHSYKPHHFTPPSSIFSSPPPSAYSVTLSANSAAPDYPEISSFPSIRGNSLRASNLHGHILPSNDISSTLPDYKTCRVSPGNTAETANRQNVSQGAQQHVGESGLEPENRLRVGRDTLSSSVCSVTDTLGGKCAKVEERHISTPSGATAKEYDLQERSKADKVDKLSFRESSDLYDCFIAMLPNPIREIAEIQHAVEAEKSLKTELDNSTGSIPFQLLPSTYTDAPEVPRKPDRHSLPERALNAHSEHKNQYESLAGQRKTSHYNDFAHVPLLEKSSGTKQEASATSLKSTLNRPFTTQSKQQKNQEKSNPSPVWTKEYNRKTQKETKYSNSLFFNPVDIDSPPEELQAAILDRRYQMLCGIQELEFLTELIKLKISATASAHKKRIEKENSKWGGGELQTNLI